MIYILEFSRPLGNARHSARYYLGYCEDDRLSDRLAEHQAGRGAAMTRFAVQNGISFNAVATFPGDRKTERMLKRRKNTPRIVERFNRGTLTLPPFF